MKKYVLPFALLMLLCLVPAAAFSSDVEIPSGSFSAAGRAIAEASVTPSPVPVSTPEAEPSMKTPLPEAVQIAIVAGLVASVPMLGCCFLVFLAGVHRREQALRTRQLELFASQGLEAVRDFLCASSGFISLSHSLPHRREAAWIQGLRAEAAKLNTRARVLSLYFSSDIESPLEDCLCALENVSVHIAGGEEGMPPFDAFEASVDALTRAIREEIAG